MQKLCYKTRDAARLLLKFGKIPNLYYLLYHLRSKIWYLRVFKNSNYQNLNKHIIWGKNEGVQASWWICIVTYLCIFIYWSIYIYYNPFINIPTKGHAYGTCAHRWPRKKHDGCSNSAPSPPKKMWFSLVLPMIVGYVHAQHAQQNITIILLLILQYIGIRHNISARCVRVCPWRRRRRTKNQSSRAQKVTAAAAASSVVAASTRG